MGSKELDSRPQTQTTSCVPRTQDHDLCPKTQSQTYSAQTQSQTHIPNLDGKSTILNLHTMNPIPNLCLTTPICHMTIPKPIPHISQSQAYRVFGIIVLVNLVACLKSRSLMVSEETGVGDCYRFCTSRGLDIFGIVKVMGSCKQCV